jgi:hypothetical protein
MSRPGEEKPYNIKHMQHRQYAVTSFFTMLACAVLTLSAAQSQAASATGTWSWSTPGRNGGEARKTTLTLKADGEKLTGTLSSPGRQGGAARETAISDGKVKGDEVSFSVTVEFNNNKMTRKYSGKVTDDTIKGKVEFERNGETQSRDWEAKRDK